MIKKVISIILLLCLFIFTFVSCSSEESSSEEAQTETQTEEKVVIFDKNETINDFFINYQELSNTEFKDISSNKDYNCYAENSGYYFEVRDLNDKVQVIVEQTDETSDKGIEGMKEVYFYTVKTLDNTLSDDEINNVFDSLGEYKLEETLNTVNIVIYPDKELSGGYSPGHIDITRNK